MVRWSSSVVGGQSLRWKSLAAGGVPGEPGGKGASAGRRDNRQGGRKLLQWE